MSLTDTEIRLACMQEAVKMCLVTRELRPENVATVSTALYHHVIGDSTPPRKGPKRRDKSGNTDPLS